MRIPGLSAFCHDSAAAMLEDGVVTVAAQEERFSRCKHDGGVPTRAVRYCLEAAGCGAADVDRIVCADRPLPAFLRLPGSGALDAPHPARSAVPRPAAESPGQPERVRRAMPWPEARVHAAGHRESQAAAAFFPSPFERAVVLVLDGARAGAGTAVGVGRGNSVSLEREIPAPHALGLLYSAVTRYLGFTVNGGEYKVMGLAPYGEPRYRNLIRDTLIAFEPDGTFRLNRAFFPHSLGLAATGGRLERLFGRPARTPEQAPLTPFHMDVAASLQAVTEEAVLRLTRALARDHGLPNLCLAGDLALNCVANGKVLRDGAFDAVWVQPAAGDAGKAVGAALAAWHHHLDKPRRPAPDGRDGMRGARLGPAFGQAGVERRLRAAGAVFHVLDDTALLEATVDALVAEKVVGWFQGRMEFGPRALGGRSILADPRSPRMQRTLNLKIKYRENFRPFAPAVLREAAAEWFDLEADSPYMLFAAPVREAHRRAMTEDEKALFGIDKLNVVRATIPAVTHVDYSARVQTVDGATSPRFHALIRRFGARTGCPVVVNTSFNVRGEPIVSTPEDAFRCFMGTEMDTLVVGNCLLHKAEQESDNPGQPPSRERLIHHCL